MTDILFKAKKKTNGEWIEGYFAKVKWYLDGSTKFVIFPTDVCMFPRCEVSEWEEVIPETICRYTGLTDSNGIKIWENDICNRKEKYPEIVMYYEGDFILDYSYVFQREPGFDYCNLGFYACKRKSVEVIGNIFDNPQLLQEGEE